jgi:hypothetical protein
MPGICPSSKPPFFEEHIATTRRICEDRVYRTFTFISSENFSYLITGWRSLGVNPGEIRLVPLK